MGCCCSSPRTDAEELFARPPSTYTEHHLEHYNSAVGSDLAPISPWTDNPHHNASSSSTMGSPNIAVSPLATQHERLILELLPFKDARQFHEWLGSGFVRGSWQEFSRDYLTRNPLAPEPEKQKTAQAAKDAINSKSTKFLVYHPDKTNWTPEDHHIRFIVQVVLDNMLKNLWSESEWKKRNIEITKAIYEVLSFLRATTLGAEPPRYAP